ncbi:hypothetical protein PR048_033169 [Dryococelus australis]|uniref:Uncharacterized protein n=1 Tax=Dryococelus australis TaxID=614101 RepID=A0ABQ9G3R0_9NEOP|nr:hypothetical protein PR048_033169 [Dryococelus australis]
MWLPAGKSSGLLARGNYLSFAGRPASSQAELTCEGGLAGRPIPLCAIAQFAVHPCEDSLLVLMQLGTLFGGGGNTQRSSFLKEYKKVQQCKKSGMSTQDAYVPRLWFYQDLLFLMDQEEAFQGLPNLDEESDPEVTCQ